MQTLKNAFSDLQEQLQRLNNLITQTIPEINFYRPVTIPVKFDNAPQSFDHIVSWSYSLIFESLSKNYDFLLKQAQKLGKALSQDAIELKRTIHYLRTFSQHSQFEQIRLAEFTDYRNAWFHRLCGQNEISSTDDWIICINNIISSLNETISCFAQTVSEAIGNEFGNIFKETWSRLALRNFAKHEYDAVLVQVLADHGLSNKIDPQLFTRKYLSDWKRGIEILPDGFEFAKEVYSIIQRSISKEDVIPINAPELLNAGIPTGVSLGKCIAEAKRSFYAEPCSADELVTRVVKWFKAQ